MRMRIPAAARLRPTLVVNAVLAVLLLGAAALSYRTVASSESTSTGTAGSGSRTVPVTQGEVAATVTAGGAVESASTANASFVTSGTVTEIDVKVGDQVQQGQVLAKVAATAAGEQLSAAQANLNSARQSLTRARTGTDAATTAAAQAQVTQAQNSVNAAQRAVDGTTLTAPMAGTVVAVNGTVGGSSGGSSAGSGGSQSGPNASGGGGNNAGGNNGPSNSSSESSATTSAGTGFVQLADLTRMQVSATFAEADATRLKTGQVAQVTWAALSGAEVSGRIATISPTATVDNNVNSYPVTVSLDSVPDGVRIGQTVSVAVTTADAQDAVRVPAAAVRGTGQRHTVDVVGVDGKHETRAVQVGVQGDQFVQITDGLQAGDQVAITIPTATNQTGAGTTRFGGGGGFNGGGFPGGGGNRGTGTQGGGRRGTG
jgi:macrolide-specific efflux system membrane fusion protein